MSIQAIFYLRLGHHFNVKNINGLTIYIRKLSLVCIFLSLSLTPWHAKRKLNCFLFNFKLYICSQTYAKKIDRIGHASSMGTVRSLFYASLWNFWFVFNMILFRFSRRPFVRHEYLCVAPLSFCWEFRIHYRCSLIGFKLQQKTTNAISFGLLFDAEWISNSISLLNRHGTRDMRAYLRLKTR